MHWALNNIKMRKQLKEETIAICCDMPHKAAVKCVLHWGDRDQNCNELVKSQAVPQKR